MTVEDVDNLADDTGLATNASGMPTEGSSLGTDLAAGAKSLTDVVAAAEPLPGDDDDWWQRMAGDTYHGGRFAGEVLGRVVWDTAAGAFYTYRGHRWRRDRRQTVKQMYIDSLATAIKEAFALPEGGDRKARIDSLHAAGRANHRIDGALRVASVSLSMEGDRWDADPWLLGCPNGVLDLRTGQLRDGKPEDAITKSVACDFRPEAQAPHFQHFLHEVFLGDNELIRWLQLLFGYALTGLDEAETFVLCHGDGQNGKSTLLNLVGRIMGKGQDGYAVTLNADAILAATRPGGAGPNEEVASLRGARIALAIEAESDLVLSDAKVKKLASRERLRASRKFEHDNEWDATHTLFVALNRLPQVNDNSEGTWRRISLVPFDASFPPESRDSTLGDRLFREEAEGILAWMVEGAVEYARRRSLYPRPAAVEEATLRYRQQEDHIGRFISECVRSATGHMVGASAAYASYTEWCADNRIGRGGRWTTQHFGQHFAARVSRELGNAVDKVRDRNKAFFYSGITINLPVGLREGEGGRNQTFPYEVEQRKDQNHPPASSRAPLAAPVSSGEKATSDDAYQLDSSLHPPTTSTPGAVPANGNLKPRCFARGNEDLFRAHQSSHRPDGVCLKCTRAEVWEAP